MKTVERSHTAIANERERQSGVRQTDGREQRLSGTLERAPRQRVAARRHAEMEQALLLELGVGGNDLADERMPHDVRLVHLDDGDIIDSGE